MDRCKVTGTSLVELDAVEEHSQTYPPRLCRKGEELVDLREIVPGILAKHELEHTGLEDLDCGAMELCVVVPMSGALQSTRRRNFCCRVVAD
jgi:hypothetical protein